MLKSPARIVLAGAILGTALLGTSPLAADGRAFNVRSFPGTRCSESIGDREAGANGAFWYGRDQYDNANGYYFPEVARLTPDGAVSVWALDTISQGFTPSQVRRNAATGDVWIVVPSFTTRDGALYRLTPGSSAVVRTALPFPAFRLHLDPVDGTPWMTGTGRIAKLSGGTLSIYEIENTEGRSGGIDASRRIWLTADNRSLRAFNVATGTLEVWADAGAGVLDPVIDPSGRVWGVGTAQTSVLRFDPATRELTRFPNPLTASNWARAGIGTDFVNIASSYGPHFLSLAPSKVSDSTSTTLAAPATTTLNATTSTPATRTLTAVTRQDQIPPLDRTVYLEDDGGRHLYTASAGYAALLWSNGGETLVGTGPLELWQALPSGQSFATTAALPVAVEVRPEDPVNNFLTEVTVTNIDASPNVTLVLTTGSQSFSYPLQIPAGSSRVLPNVMDALRSADAPIPQGAVGTLVARFVNGKGLLNARVYTKFGAGAPFPPGSTTGLGFTSLDPASRAGLYRTTLNGLKNTPGFRSNVAIANLCGFTGTPCATLSMSLDFFDDATGLQVGSKDLQVPPDTVAQLNSPLADFPGAVGETFSVIIQPYQSGFANYDAYATVVSNANQDAAFIRATGNANSYTVTLSVVTDAGGIGTRFSSECAVTNTGGGTAVADVTFTSARTGNQVKEVLTLEPRRGVRYANAVDHYRLLAPSQVGTDDFGSIRIAFREFANGIATARTVASNGTGLGYDGLDPYLSRASRRKRIIGLTQSDAVRTNLAVVHLGATTGDPEAPITVRVTVTDRNGNRVGEPLVQTLAPGNLFQWTRILSDFFGVTGEGYVATIERIAGNDAFDAYVTLIDNVSSDPTFLRAE